MVNWHGENHVECWSDYQGHKAYTRLEMVHVSKEFMFHFLSFSMSISLFKDTYIRIKFPSLHSSPSVLVNHRTSSHPVPSQSIQTHKKLGDIKKVIEMPRVIVLRDLYTFHFEAIVRSSNPKK